MRAWRSDAPSSRLLGWLGIAWVYSGVVWLVGLWMMIALGWGAGAAGMALRLAATLLLGVGLCALERWAWAAALCLAAAYTLFAAALALAAGGTAFWAYGHAFSWMPVFLGLKRDLALRVACGACGVAVISGGMWRCLWSFQPEFDVPYRRPFTVLVQHGLLPAALVFLIDAYLLAGWWVNAAVR